MAVSVTVAEVGFVKLLIAESYGRGSHCIICKLTAVAVLIKSLIRIEHNNSSHDSVK
jgi:hypothetical protein